jgi:small-conductance mechanosensitive channel
VKKEQLSHIAKGLTTPEFNQSLQQVINLFSGSEEEEHPIAKTLAGISLLAEQMKAFDENETIKMEVKDICNQLTEVISEINSDDCELDDLKDMFGPFFDELEEQLDVLVERNSLRKTFSDRIITDLERYLTKTKDPFNCQKVLRKIGLSIKVILRRMGNGESGGK